jgi:DNA polymerase III subunit epsilon
MVATYASYILVLIIVVPGSVSFIIGTQVYVLEHCSEDYFFQRIAAQHNHFLDKSAIIRVMGIFDEPLVFVDIETNGLSPIRGRVVEVAAIRVEQGEVTAVFNKLIDPGAPLPRFITNLTGITNDDVRGAPVFLQVAEELHEILKDAIFVAHNVRFDYSFLKQEFNRVGKSFTPKQLCTVRLSRALYPEHRGHKLADLIERHGFSYQARHRAYDDAHILWQFMQHATQNFSAEILQAAVAKQIKQPSLPKNLDPQLVKDLPNDAGVYIFEDEAGHPLYVGKSVTIRKRVLSHFSNDHEITSEFKIAQHTANIRTISTGSELEALLLESQLVKELQPLYNKQLRRTSKLLLARRLENDTGHYQVVLEEANEILPEESNAILAVYPRRGAAKESLEYLQKTYDLCPKLLGLEKTKGACFSKQLHKCRGACVNQESPEHYNQRLAIAFQNLRIEQWPFKSAVAIKDLASPLQSGIIVDQWCVVAQFRQDEDCEPVIKTLAKHFDLDAYKILRSYLQQKRAQLHIVPVSLQELAGFV